VAETPISNRAGYVDRAVEAAVRGNDATTAPAAPRAVSVDAALAAAAAKKGSPLTATERLRIRTQHTESSKSQ